MRIRKQIYELTLDDLDNFPMWEFCLDEEGEEGQDECTVRPIDVNEFDFETMFVCSSEFILASGEKRAGYITPANELGESQPSILTANGSVGFWFGIIEPKRTDIESAYRKLRGKQNNIFPIVWRTSLKRDDLPCEGQIDGFYYLNAAQNIIKIT